MSEANKQLVRRHFEELFNRQHLAAAELVAQEYLEHAVAPFGQAEPGKVNGPTHLRQTAQWLLAQFPDLHMTVQAIVAEGDTVAVRILSQGANLGALNGVLPPTGKRFAARQSHWFRVTDGKLAEHWAPARTSRRCCSGAWHNRQADRRPSLPRRRQAGSAVVGARSGRGSTHWSHAAMPPARPDPVSPERANLGSWEVRLATRCAAS